MLKDMLTDIAKELLKFVAGFTIPVCLVLIGALLFGLGIKLESVVLLGVGAIVAVCGTLWALFILLWHSA